MSSIKRVFGLDIVRSLAIILVLCAHSLDHFIIPNSTGGIGWLASQVTYPIGFFGVEMFFVLSGFLIGGIIIRDVVEKGTFNSLFNFFLRRWFRTLPLYYLVVLFLILFPTLEEFSWTNLFFIQNFDSRDLLFNPISWSLSVEEWFYLTIPLIMLVLLNFNNKKNKETIFFFVCFFVIALSYVLRVVTVELNSNVEFDFGIRKQIFLRLDSIMFGVVLAGIKYYYTKSYDRLVSYPKILFAFTISGLLFCGSCMVFNIFGVLDESFIMRTLFFDFVSLFCVLLISFADTIKNTNNYGLGKKINWLSRTSYAVYLLHFQFFVIVKNIVRPNNLYKGVIACSCAVVLTFIISYVVHRYYEIPLMNLRDKFKPKPVYKKKKDIGRNKGA
ncbi:acyltransferase family protein [Neobacillus drentensis]|uniref:acyltransferase family protein n=1 Tax=Neobacillus drentensis TaxID=220684 RepID=UPI003000625A